MSNRCFLVLIFVSMLTLHMAYVSTLPLTRLGGGVKVSASSVNVNGTPEDTSALGVSDSDSASAMVVPAVGTATDWIFSAVIFYVVPMLFLASVAGWMLRKEHLERQKIYGDLEAARKRKPLHPQTETTWILTRSQPIKTPHQQEPLLDQPFDTIFWHSDLENQIPSLLNSYGSISPTNVACFIRSNNNGNGKKGEPSIVGNAAYNNDDSYLGQQTGKQITTCGDYFDMTDDMSIDWSVADSCADSSPNSCYGTGIDSRSRSRSCSCSGTCTSTSFGTSISPGGAGAGVQVGSFIQGQDGTCHCAKCKLVRGDDGNLESPFELDDNFTEIVLEGGEDGMEDEGHEGEVEEGEEMEREIDVGNEGRYYFE